MSRVEECHICPASHEAVDGAADRIVEADDSARQGPEGRPVLMVLLSSLALVVIVASTFVLLG